VVLKRAEKEKRELTTIREEESDAKAYVTIPFVAGTSEKIARALRRHDVVTRFNCVTKIIDGLPSAKDSIPPGLREGVYQVPCTYGKYYIGETCRSLSVRLREHQRAATKNNTRPPPSQSTPGVSPGKKSILEKGETSP
jgi:hypothetical protein